MFSRMVRCRRGTSGSRQTSDAVARPIGREIGQQAPAFALMDQFGHEQSNKTLKVQKGQFSFSFVPPIGDPSAKHSSCSCKTPKIGSKSRGFIWLQ
jgi:hypothetical protein